MVQTNGTKSYTRAEEERCYGYSDTRKHTSTGQKGESTWHEQKRTYRTDSSNPLILHARESNSGKIIDQLIDKICKQILLRESELSEMRIHVDELRQIREQLGEIETPE